MLDSSQKILTEFVTPMWYCQHGNPSKTALRAYSSSGLEKVSGEPSLCPSRFQELAEPEPLEAVTAPASKAATRAARPPTACSMFEMLFVIDATDCVSDKILFPNLANPCTSMGIEANAANCTSNWANLLVSMASNFSSIVLVRDRPLLQTQEENQ